MVVSSDSNLINFSMDWTFTCVRVSPFGKTSKRILKQKKYNCHSASSPGFIIKPENKLIFKDFVIIALIIVLLIAYLHILKPIGTEFSLFTLCSLWKQTLYNHLWVQIMFFWMWEGRCSNQLIMMSRVNEIVQFCHFSRWSTINVVSINVPHEYTVQKVSLF